MCDSFSNQFLVLHILKFWNQGAYSSRCSSVNISFVMVKAVTASAEWSSEEQRTQNPAFALSIFEFPTWHLNRSMDLFNSYSYTISFPIQWLTCDHYFRDLNGVHRFHSQEKHEPHTTLKLKHASSLSRNHISRIYQRPCCKKGAQIPHKKSGHKVTNKLKSEDIHITTMPKISPSKKTLDRAHMLHSLIFERKIYDRGIMYS